MIRFYKELYLEIIHSKIPGVGVIGRSIVRGEKWECSGTIVRWISNVSDICNGSL
jgi:hypothetical protein